MKKIIQKLATFWNQQLSRPADYPFVMHEEEKTLLKKYLSHSKNYLEFGLGGSTIFALIKTSVNVISVDTNQEWISFIKKYRIIRNNLNKRLQIFYVNIGPTVNWGFPQSDEFREKFPDFSSLIFSKINCKDIDVILVDGRFRIACALQSIIHGHVNKNLSILIHDYSFREEYKILEEFLNLKEFEKTLYVFSVKENLNIEQVKARYEEYKYNPN